MARRILPQSDYIRELWPMRHNPFTRIMLWNAIGRERWRREIRAREYPRRERFLHPIDVPGDVYADGTPVPDEPYSDEGDA